jgi:hypothetical protein
LLADSGPFPSAFRRRDRMPSRENGHTPRARSASVEVRWWRTDPRDRPSDWSGPVDGPHDNQTLPGCRAEPAAARRYGRCRAGGEAVRRRQHEAGPAAAGRARLGEHPSRAQAIARHAVDPLGRVHRAQSGGLPLLPLLRAVPNLGRQALGHDAPDSRRWRLAVRRLRRRHLWHLPQPTQFVSRVLTADKSEAYFSIDR